MARKSKSHVYVAGPIGKAEHHESNAIHALEWTKKIISIGLHPFVPHLWVWGQKHLTQTYEEWMKYDFAWIDRCDAVFRIPGHSPGADREVAYALDRNMPVFFEIPELILWARK